jgi:hypothetical protein
MNVIAVNKYVKPLIENDNLFYITTTSIKSIYKSHIKDVEFDDEAEIMSWTDVNNGLKYYLDYTDINFAVESTPDSRIARNAY